MSETVQALKDGVSWVCGMTLLSEDTEIRPASLSYVKPSEYRMSAENLIARLYDALETAQRERAEWEANAQRENALLVQAQQRIAALEAEAQDVKRVGGNVLLAFEDWPAYQTASADGERRTALDSLAAALGRMLKEGE